MIKLSKILIDILNLKEEEMEEISIEIFSNLTDENNSDFEKKGIKKFGKIKFIYFRFIITILKILYKFS